MIDIDKLGELDTQAKAIKTLLEKGKEEIKAQDKSELEGKTYVAKVQIRQSNKFNAEKALKVAKEYDLQFLIKEAIDEDKLNDALISGEIDAGLFDGCVTTKETKAVTFKRKKK